MRSGNGHQMQRTEGNKKNTRTDGEEVFRATRFVEQCHPHALITTHADKLDS
jgi:hypothetical protein